MYIIYEIVYFKNAYVFFNKNNLKNVALHSRIIFIEYFLYDAIRGDLRNCLIYLCNIHYKLWLLLFKQIKLNKEKI